MRCKFFGSALLVPLLILLGCGRPVRSVPPTFSYPPSPVIHEFENAQETRGLRGRVVVIDGTPMKDVLVEEMTPGWKVRLRGCMTDEKGRFDLGRADAGQHYLRFMKPGFNTVHVRVLLTLKAQGELVVELSPSA